jgi:hypothetical protein
VANPDRAVQVIVLRFLSQYFDPAGRLRDLDATFARDRADPRAVVAAVFQSPQSFQQELFRPARPDVSDNTTHGSLDS